jgi:hypothetical protein
MATEPLTLEGVREQVETIERLGRYDYEAAHSAEDSLHQDVLRHLAERGEPLAVEALKTLAFDFSRHCA